MNNIFESQPFGDESLYVLTTHVNPDWDGIGAIVAISSLLNRLTLHHYVVLDGEIPSDAEPFLRRLNFASELNLNSKNLQLIVFDTNDLARIPRNIDIQSFGKVLIVDHHQLYDLPHEKISNFVDENASSTSEIVANYLLKQNYDFDSDVAILLYAGIYSDSGGFRFTKTSPDTLRTASALLERTHKLEFIDKFLFQNKSFDDLKFLRFFYKNLKSDFENQFCYTFVKVSELMEEGLNIYKPSQNLDTLLSARSVKVAMLVREISEESCKVYLRSKPGYEIIEILRAIGGGGHPNAGGAKLNKSLSDTVIFLKALIQPLFIKY